MFDRLPALSRASQRVSRARNQRRASRVARLDAHGVVSASPRIGFGESMAIGMGCDRWSSQL